MNGIQHFETFLVAGILLNLTPGSDTFFILSRSIAQGRNSGIVSALGIGTGNLVHTLFAALGLSLILAQSPLLFSSIKFAGAGYLIYMGINMIRTKQTNGPSAQNEQRTSLVKIYSDGLITNVLNPKVALFFLAFLPQFVSGESKSILPIILLGATFTTTGTIWCLVLAFFASSLSSRLKGHSGLGLYLHKICGTVMIGLGLKLAFTSK